MPRPPSTHPTDGELEILRVLWDRGPLALSELCEALRRERDVATTTVATMLRIMLDKRLVAHLVEAGQLSPKELAELRELIDSNKTSRKGAKAQRISPN
jgi:predicted transcriptional regulator